MKIGVLKLGARIAFGASDTSGGNGEARAIVKMLQQGGAEVHIFTKILKKDLLLSEYIWHNIGEDQSTSGMDAIVVINGAVNFFGGAEDREQLLNYQMINEFTGPVFYIYCDPSLVFKQAWASVEKKPWASNWTKAQLNVTRDIIYISQPFDTDFITDNLKSDIKPVKISHYPFEQFPCLLNRFPINPAPEYDLLYGGTMRSNRRVKKMVEYYFGHDLNVGMFGKISLDDFDSKYDLSNPPAFLGSVKYDEMLPMMNKSMAHCVIGDPFYEKSNDIPQRFYEALWAGSITFVDDKLDTKLRAFGSTDKEVVNFLRVQSRSVLNERLKILKSDYDLRSSILNSIISGLNFNSDEYCQNFVKLIKELA